MNDASRTNDFAELLSLDYKEIKEMWRNISVYPPIGSLVMGANVEGSLRGTSFDSVCEGLLEKEGAFIHHDGSNIAVYSSKDLAAKILGNEALEKNPYSAHQTDELTERMQELL